MNTNTIQQRIPKRILSSLISSLSAGVVPRSGAPFIAIGRKDEISAFLSDLETVNEGGSTMRFLIGRYGSGKSFLIQLIRGYAIERGFICADCDLSPDRRLYGTTSGSGQATYRELMRNLSTKSCPDGGALASFLSALLFNIQSKLSENGINPESNDYSSYISASLRELMKEVEFLVGGFDFSRVITKYYMAYLEGNDDLSTACLRWLRGEYSSKTEARRELGFDVSVVICDDNWYDFIKLWAVLSSKTGYRGFMVFIDECVNLYKIPNRISRENNYEKILSMFNDTLQGKAQFLGIVFGGTPQFLEDPRRGLYSYDALRSRLSDSRYSEGGFRNLIGPVIRLVRLTDDELLALIVRLTYLHSLYYSWTPPITSEDQEAFLRKSLSRAGADEMITPREIIRDYLAVLNIILQNPGMNYSDLDLNSKNQKQTKIAEPMPDEEHNYSENQVSGLEITSKKEAQEKTNYFSPDDIVF